MVTVLTGLAEEHAPLGLVVAEAKQLVFPAAQRMERVGYLKSL
jgi:hypothetical protein